MNEVSEAPIESIQESTKQATIEKLGNEGKSIGEIAKQVYGEDTSKTRNLVHTHLSHIKKRKTQPTESGDSIDTTTIGDTVSPDHVEPASTLALPSTISGKPQGAATPVQRIREEKTEFKIDTSETPIEASAIAQQYRDLTQKELGIAAPSEIEEQDKIDMEALGDVIGSEPVNWATDKMFHEPLTPKERGDINKATKRVIEKRVAWMSPFGDLINLAIHIGKAFLKRLFKVK